MTEAVDRLSTALADRYTIERVSQIDVIHGSR